jgi:hypothetical protein
LAQSLRREQVLFRFVDRLHRAESETMIYEAALDSILSGCVVIVAQSFSSMNLV